MVKETKHRTQIEVQFSLILVKLITRWPGNMNPMDSFEDKQ